MSPLAPLENGSQSFDQKTENQPSLINRGPNDKFTYSMGALYGMRHGDRRVPNLGNRVILESISRMDAIPSMHGSSTFSQRIISSTMERFQRDRRQLNHHRPMGDRPRLNRNGSNDGQNQMYRGERPKQPNHGKCNVTRTFFFCCSHTNHNSICWVMFTQTGWTLRLLSFFCFTHTLSFVI